MFGAAEAGAFPTLSRALARWFPAVDRGKVNGFMWMGARIGGAVSPPLATMSLLAYGWRLTVFLFGLIGLIWCAVFWFWYRDDPADHRQVNAAELAYIRQDSPTETTSAPARHEKTPWSGCFRAATCGRCSGCISPRPTDSGSS